MWNWNTENPTGLKINECAVLMKTSKMNVL